MCKEIIHKKKVINNFWLKMKLGQLEFSLFLTFSISNFFHEFSVQVLNIILANQNRNMHIFYKKKFQS